MKNNRLHLSYLSVLGALCTMAFAVLPTKSALAQDWRFEPIFRAGGEYDDNATLDPRTDQEVELSGYLLSARADIFYSSQASSFFLQPKFVSRNYNDSTFDSDDFFLRSNFRRRGELSTVGFRVNFEDQSVRTGERSDSDLEIEDPDEITGDDSGRTFRSGRRTKLRASPYWAYELSKLSSIGANFDFFDIQYDNVFAGLLTDYTDMRLDLNYRRSLSNVTTWGISLTGRRYDAENSPQEIDGYGLLAEIAHTLSEKTRVSARIGLEAIDESGVESDPELVGGVTLTRNLQTIRLLAQYRRSLSGSGTGNVAVRDSFNLNFRRRLNERISAGLGVRVYQQKGSNVSRLDRDYAQLHASLAWYLTKSFVVEANYRYTVQDRGGALGESANSNNINLWFVFQPNTIPKI
jgi:hypothetical protein